MNILVKSAFAALALGAISCPTLAGPIESLLAGSAPDLTGALSSFGLPAVAAWWASGGPLGAPAGTAATLATCWLASLLALSGLEGAGRGSDGGPLGSARVREGREVVAGSETWDGRSSPGARGIVYGYARGRYLFEPGRFALIDGATGSGKSRYLLIPTIDLLTYGDGSAGSEPHTIVVSDVKNELVELCGDELARRGYEVLLLDTASPLRGQRFNPLGRVCRLAAGGRRHEAELAADALAAVVVPDDGPSGASHWALSARSLLSALVLYVATAEGCPDGARHMATVDAVLCRGTEGAGDDPAAPLKEVLRGLPEGHPARSRASQFLSSGGNELRSVLSTLKVATRTYSSAPVAWMTSESDIDPEGVLSGKTALFLHSMDEDGAPYNAVLTVLLDQLWAAARERAEAEGGALARPVTIVGDEWGNLPRMPGLPALLSLGRSYRFYWAGAVQNVAQLNKYGERDGRRKVLANCGIKVALKLGEEEDRRYFTELVGRTTRHPRGTSSSRGRAPSSSTSYSEQADDVIHPWEWLEMSPDRDGAIVVKQAENGVPKTHAGAFRAPLADCSRTPTGRHFDLGSPEHEAARRRDYRRRLDERAAVRDASVETWCPEWPAAAAATGEDDEWSAL